MYVQLPLVDKARSTLSLLAPMDNPDLLDSPPCPHLKKRRRRRFFALAAFLGAVAVVALLIALYATHVSFPTARDPLLFYATPKRDDLKLTLMKAIQQAQSSLWICSYGLSDADILSALQKKAASGVRVDLVYHASINRTLHRIATNALHCHPKRDRGLMHEKLVIVDDTLIFFGSTNLTTSSLSMHNNCLLGLHAPQLARDLKERQSSSYHYSWPSDQTLDLFLLPQGASKALTKLLATLESAQKRVVVALFTFTHPLLVEKLIALHRRGVTVDLFLDRFSARGASKKAVSALIAAGIPVKVNQGPALFHHKWALIDDQTLVLGSANWTRKAFKTNRELLLIFTPLSPQQITSLQRAVHTFQQKTRVLNCDRQNTVQRKFDLKKRKPL